jgi:hypothetical protein
MNHHFRWPPFIALLLALAFGPAAFLTAQTAFVCYDRGSTPVAATWEAGPDLGCEQAPGWPYWHLFTPAHRDLVSKPGCRPGDTVMLPRILVHYRCTGWLLVPVVVDRVRVMGQVPDTAEQRCLPDRPITP